MVKTYLKYELSSNFGIVSTASSNVTWAPEPTSQSSIRNTGAGRVYTGANEDVLCWDIKKGELLGRWRDKNNTAQVTALSQSQVDHDIFAVGYSDGSIRLWDASTATVIISFNGHRSAVTLLAFDDTGARLASGSRDTDIILWDLVAETGLFKLRGHKEQITGLRFIRPAVASTTDEDQDTTSGALSTAQVGSYLLSTSKDALIKLWDLTSQVCIETHVTQSNGECWALGMSPDGSGCITAGNDGELRLWAVDGEGLTAHSTALDRGNETRLLLDRGTLSRQAGRDRVTGVHFHPNANYFAIHGADKAAEIWRIRDPLEVQKSLARKRKRRREKAAQKGVDVDADMQEDEQEDADTPPDVKDIFVPHTIVRTGGKIRSVDWTAERVTSKLQLIVSTTNNQVEYYLVEAKARSKKSSPDQHIEYDRAYSVEMPGHRTDVRALSLSSDDKMLASASSGNLKIWNLKSSSCIRTLDCSYALCSVFLPGDKIVIVGNKEGTLELFDIVSSTLIDTVQAHDGAIWTMRVHPDGQSLITGSADKSIKFWNFKVIQEEIPGTRRTTPRLKLAHSRTLKLADEVLNICFSPDNGRLLAAATLDNTVKVFFNDSLKLYLTLYGHALPVLSIAISSDSKLIATCSSDKTLRIWGLDFGDCHKSFLAHEDSIMAVAFPPHPISRDDAHLVFSVSKDGLLKTWDADKFQAVQTLRGHAGEIWALALSRTADFAVTASHDKSIRVWRQSDEPLFLDEERERELEDAYDAKLTAQMDRDEQDRLALADVDVNGDAQGGTAPATKQTSTTLTAGERIVEALNLCYEDLQVVREYEAALKAQPDVPRAPPQRNPLLALRNMSAEQHLLGVVEQVPAPALEDALLLLPFSVVASLFTFLSIWLQRGMNVPLTCRVFFFLLKLHHKQIVASGKGSDGDGQGLRQLLIEMQGRLRAILNQEKQSMGFNLAACKVLGKRIGESKVHTLEDAMEEENTMRSGKKRGFVNVA